MTNKIPYLDIHNAQVYQGENCVFNALNLQLWRGENTCILGPNGAGKSTLLKLLTRELYPVAADDSYVKIDGSETAIIWELRKKMGLVSQDLQNRYDAHVLGRDVVMSGLFGSIGMHGHFDVRDEHREKVQEILHECNLTALQDRRYWHLSTGQQRRFLLARALIHRPQILILDEPTNGLDLKAAHELIAQLRQLAQQGTTLLLVTHHMHEIFPEFTRLILLKEGRIFADGKIVTLMRDDTVSELFNTPLTVKHHQGFYQVFPA
jgi:iron complex transport system ATP-binding protein